MKKLTFILLFAIVFSGCAQSINELNAKKYYASGEKAIAQGNLSHAKKMFSKALINARLGDMEPDAEANLYMKLGRINGNICKYDEAEKDFLDAIAIYKENDKSDSNVLFISTMELGQFSYDIGKYENAVVYFKKALEIGGEKYKDKHPSTYYEILRDFTQV